MIHIVNGDVVRKRLKVEGEIIIWREMYDLGPLCSHWDEEEMIMRRTDFFERKYRIPPSLFMKTCRKQLDLLRHIPDQEEIVLWFEHDRYDQTMLMYVLNQLSGKVNPISMVTLDHYPNVEPFYGLGQLTETQLNELLPGRMQLTREHMTEAITGWKAYVSDQQEDLTRWLTEENHPLPFLAKALWNHLDYYPQPQNGLSKVEEDLLEKLEEGSILFGDLFDWIKVRRMEDGLSNLYVAALLRELAQAPHPLLMSDQGLPDFEDQTLNPVISITDHGRDVLKGEKNRIDLSGIDWWTGGVHFFKKY